MVAYLDEGGARHLVKKVLDRIQPVGSLYYSTNDTSPASLFGGSWERYAQGRVMVSASDTDGDFSVGKTGGSKTHSHLYGLVYGDYYGMAALHIATNDNRDHHTGVIDYESHDGNRISPHTKPPISSIDGDFAKTVDGSYGRRNIALMQTEGNVQTVSSMDPYIAVYIWRRTA